MEGCHKPLEVEDDRLNPIYLSAYLERLFPRAASKVRELTEGYGLRFKTGSVMGLEDLKHEVDSGVDILSLTLPWC